MPSPDLLQLFHATDELAAEIDAQKHRLRGLDATIDGLQIELSQRSEQHAQLDSALVDVSKTLEADFMAQVESIDRIVDSLREIEAAIEKGRGDAQHSVRLTEQAAAETEHGADALSRTLHDLARLRPAEQPDALGALGRGVQAMREQFRTLEEVVDQGDLLALNAEIVSAQAGDAGKAFATVADDLRLLAEQSGAATREVASLLAALEHQVKHAGLPAEQAEMPAGRREGAAEIDAALRKIVDASRKTIDTVDGSARAVAEQATRSQQASDATAALVEQLRERVRESQRRLSATTVAAERRRRPTPQSGP
jgi:methyl-accepting chemotaxis protein